VHPGCIAVFAFDHSSNHLSYAQDALVASRMNLSSGGKQPLMRNTYMRNGQLQTMVLPNGQPKGMKIVLEERGLWKIGLLRTCKECKNHTQVSEVLGCCAFRILSLEPDFLAQKSHLEEIVEKAGHKIIFYPKYHCELNYIESFWGATKQYARKNCNYSFKELERTVPLALNSVSLCKIRKFARRCYRFMSAYRLELSGRAAIFAAKKYKSHRKVPESVLMDVDILSLG